MHIASAEAESKRWGMEMVCWWNMVGFGGLVILLDAKDELL